jgi:HEAT repeat protein
MKDTAAEATVSVTQEEALRLFSAVSAAKSEAERAAAVAAIASIIDPERLDIVAGIMAMAVDNDVRKACQKSIAEMFEKGHAGEVLTYFDGLADNEAEVLAPIFGLVSDPKAAPVLIEEATAAIDDGQGGLASALAYGLARIGTVEAEGALLAMISSASFPSQHVAVVKAVNDRESLPALEAIALGKQDGISLSLREEAIRALGNYPGNDVRHVIELIANSDPNQRLREIAADVARILSD